MAVTIKWLPSTATDTTPVALTSLAYGVVVRPGSATATFKIGNTGTSTAEQVVVKETGTDAEAVGWKTFSLDATTYNATVSLPNIAPNGISGTVTGKATIDAAATLGDHTTQTRVEYIYA